MEKERKKIIEAALDVLSENGIANSSLEMIAGRAGLDVGIARALFVDKKRLFDTVLIETSEPLVSSISLAIADEDDPAKMFRKAMALLDQWAYDNPRVIRVFTWAMIEDPEFYAEVHSRAIFPSEFFNRITEMATTGKLKIKEPEIISLMMDSLIFVTHLFRPAYEKMYSPQELQAFLERRFEAAMMILEEGMYTGERGKASG